MASKKGKTITIFSTKGGVGKTVFTLNLAATYHLMGKKVLIIDFDLYSGGVAVSLSIDETKDLYNLVDDLNNNRFTEFKDYVVKYNENIDVLACPVDPRQGSKIDSKYVEIVLVNAYTHYDVILIDTSHILNDVNLMALDKTDEIALLLTNDPVDVKNMKSLISILKDNEIDNYYIILNNSYASHKDVFSVFDIKNIIKTNIDYTIGNSFHIKEIDKYILKGEIPLLNKTIMRKKKADYAKFKQIASKLLEKDVIKDE
ncbi:MAG: MinD/ParA family protein [Bacilli bacterium]|nr:MinD/ParA family protein [Bacilli bacterium]